MTATTYRLIAFIGHENARFSGAQKIGLHVWCSMVQVFRRLVSRHADSLYLSSITE